MRRAWVEINIENLENNVKEIQKIIPKRCNIMAVVKANAYGHGMIEIANALNHMGIQDFAVATLSEAIFLREKGIQGNILILGYTEIEGIQEVIDYDLIQTIVDYEYAEKLNSLGKNIKAHVKVNTGMNRLGEADINKIISMYEMKNLTILGIYSHLCVSGSDKKEDMRFTNKQISILENCVQEIKMAGYEPGKIHLQASYGILNYPWLTYDYVRPGIILYGVFNEKPMVTQMNLKPVLALKAKISSVRQIKKGEAVGYGRTYIADTDKKIATVCIGYADGYPSNLAGQGTKILIQNQYAEIIGRICMDQLMIDVTNIEDVMPGDVVTLIGEEEEIRAEKLAEKSHITTNELLSRLGERLERRIVK